MAYPRHNVTIFLEIASLCMALICGCVLGWAMFGPETNYLVLTISGALFTAFLLITIALILDPDRIREALRRCTAEPAPAASAAPPVLHRIAVNNNRSTTLLDTDEITYIETDGIGRGCILHTISGKSYPDTTSLGEYESRLGEQDFYRIHKTCLVHLRYIVSIFPWTGNSFALRVRSTDSVLPISRERVRELRRRLNI